MVFLYLEITGLSIQGQMYVRFWARNLVLCAGLWGADKWMQGKRGMGGGHGKRMHTRECPHYSQRVMDGSWMASEVELFFEWASEMELLNMLPSMDPRKSIGAHLFNIETCYYIVALFLSNLNSELVKYWKVILGCIFFKLGKSCSQYILHCKLFLVECGEQDPWLTHDCERCWISYLLFFL